MDRRSFLKMSLSAFVATNLAVRFGVGTFLAPKSERRRIAPALPLMEPFGVCAEKKLGENWKTLVQVRLGRGHELDELLADKIMIHTLECRSAHSPIEMAMVFQKY